MEDDCIDSGQVEFKPKACSNSNVVKPQTSAAVDNRVSKTSETRTTDFGAGNSSVSIPSETQTSKEMEATLMQRYICSELLPGSSIYAKKA